MNNARPDGGKRVRKFGQASPAGGRAGVALKFFCSQLKNPVFFNPFQDKLLKNRHKPIVFV
jgi:hypothetical protein